MYFFHMNYFTCLIELVFCHLAFAFTFTLSLVSLQIQEGPTVLKETTHMNALLNQPPKHKTENSACL